MKQVYAVIGAIALAGALYFAPVVKNKNPEDKTVASRSSSTVNEGNWIDNYKQQLTDDQRAEVTTLETKLKRAEGDSVVTVTEMLGKKWEAFHQPAVAGFYFERIAENKPGEKSWLNAAFRYFDGFKLAQDSSLRAFLVDKTIFCYRKVLEFNPKNLDAKTDLGVCYTETNNPMQGISLLREVIAENPNHEYAQLNLGFLSVKSGQYDKAIERFEKVKTINPSNVNVYIYLAQTFIQKGDKERAVKNFEEFAKRSKDPAAVREVKNYIEKIKNNS